MSNYQAPAYHPCTGQVELASWLDDYYGEHLYGVKFPGCDNVHDAENCRLSLAQIKEHIMKATDTQVGGTHYKDMPIQPVEYIHKNGLSFLEGNVVKYITRHKTKNGKADVEKALHYCQLILQLEYGEGQ
jgi:hypothetical protein